MIFFSRYRIIRTKVQQPFNLPLDGKGLSPGQTLSKSCTHAKWRLYHHQCHQAWSCDSVGLRLKIKDYYAHCCAGLSLWPWSNDTTDMYSMISDPCLNFVCLCLSDSQSPVQLSPLPSRLSQTLWAPPTPSVACWASPNPVPRARGATTTVRSRSSGRGATHWLHLFYCGSARMEAYQMCSFLLVFRATDWIFSKYEHLHSKQLIQVKV